MSNEGVALKDFLQEVAEAKHKKTFTDYLSDIPFYTGYWLTYPFIWFAFWLWMGIVQAKEEIWD